MPAPCEDNTVYTDITKPVLSGLPVFVFTSAEQCATVASLDEKVKVSGTDAVSGYLNDKLSPQVNTYTMYLAGGNEALQISALDQATSVTWGSNQTDYSIPAYTSHLRVTLTANVTLYSMTGNGGHPGSGRIILIDRANDAYTLTIKHDDGATGTATRRFHLPGSTDLLLRANEGQTVAFNSSVNRWKAQVRADSDEKVKVSSDDTTPGYLNGKLVAGTNVTLVEGNGGGNETLTVDAISGIQSVSWSSDQTDYTLPAGKSVLLVTLTANVLLHNVLLADDLDTAFDGRSLWIIVVNDGGSYTLTLSNATSRGEASLTGAFFLGYYDVPFRADNGIHLVRTAANNGWHAPDAGWLEFIDAAQTTPLPGIRRVSISAVSGLALSGSATDGYCSITGTPATSSQQGMVSTSTQAFGGRKTFADGAGFSKYVTFVRTDVTWSSNQTDFAIADGTTYLVVNTTAATSLYSVVVPAAIVDPLTRHFWIVNKHASNALTIIHDDGSTGTAAYRIYTDTGTSIVLGENDAAFVWYDTGVSRWRAYRLGNVQDGDKGDIAVSSSGTVWTIDNDAVTYAKLQNISATDRLLGRDTAGAGDCEELTVGGGVEFTGSGGIQTSAFTGDATKSAGGTATTVVSAAGSFALLGNIVPSQITADQNDYNPTGLSTASTLRLSTDASRNITGLADGANGRLIAIHNIGSFDIVLKDSSGLSIAANRFDLSGDITLAAGDACLLQYDSVSLRWRCLGKSSGGGGGSTSPLTTKGDLWGFSSVDARVPVGANGQVLSADSTEALGVKWVASSGSPGGSDTHVQFNDGGAFGGEADFAYNKTDNQFTVPGLTQTQDLLLTGVISPTQLTGNVNEYGPTGFETATIFRLSSDAERTITGLFSSTPDDGRIIILHNVGSNTIVLADESASSAAGVRFALAGDLYLYADEGCILRYDGTSSRWRCLGRYVGDPGLIYRAFQAQQTVRLTGVASPAQITADQNDYNPAGLSTSSILRLTSDATRTITGLTVDGGTPDGGTVVFLANIGSNNIVLANESVSSTASVRFALQASLTVPGGGGVLLWYDNTSQRWRAIAVYTGAGSGTVTSITGGTGLSGGTITVAGTLALDINSLTGTDVAIDDYLPEYDTSAAAVRKISVDRVLGYTARNIFDFRLTTETGVALSTSDRTNQGTIYLTPCDRFSGISGSGSARMTIYDGSRWKLHISAELSLALSSLTSDKNYDVFVYDNSGTLTLELSAAWTNDTTRATELVMQDGVLVKDGATTRRYCGTIRTTSTTATEDSAVKRFVWNLYNQAPRDMFTCPGYSDNNAATSYNSTSTSYVEANGGTASKVEFVCGVPTAVAYNAHMYSVNSSVNQECYVAVGEDSTSNAAVANGAQAYTNQATINAHVGKSRSFTQGYHYLDLLIRVSGSTGTYFADLIRAGSAADVRATFLEAQVIG